MSPRMSPPMPPDDETLTVEGTVVRVTYESDESGFRVVKVRPTDVRSVAPSLFSTSRLPPGAGLARARAFGRNSLEEKLVTVVGKMPPVMAGETIRAVGKREHDNRHGDQLRADLVTSVTPATTAGLVRYLASGAVKGIGAGTAQRIVDTFGDQSIAVLDQAPERLTEVAGLGRAKAEMLARAWGERRVLRELMVTLAALDVAPSVAMRIHKRYGDKAIEIVRRTPYRLAIEVWGVGFRTADAIARQVGIALDDPQRAQAGVLHTLQTIADEGHTVSPRALVRERAARLLDPDAPPDVRDLRDDEPPDVVLLDRANEAIDSLIVAGLVVMLPEGVAHAPLADHEAGVAAALRSMLTSPPSATAKLDPQAAIAQFSKATRVTLAPAQISAVETCARARVVVVTGGPGVGKTTVVRAIVSLFEQAGLRLMLAAPTGRAAKRMTEATGRGASTIHRLLELDPRTQRFSRDELRVLEVDALIVDESSMIDVALAHALLRALPSRAHLVLVGDVDQLPSVGPGAVLRDVLESGVVPTVRLREVFRQAEGSRIVAGAHAILHGETPIPSPPMSPTSPDAPARAPHGELFIIERADPNEAASTIVDLVASRIPRAFGLDGTNDVQVLLPMVKGVVGTRALNVALQARLNPTGPSLVRGDTTFRVGDRVIQLRNDYEREIFNGDVGRVVSVDAEASTRVVTVRFDADRDVRCEGEAIDALALAYACTVHKAQGSEYPAVVVALVNAHFTMLARKLLYTAVTRARALVVIVGSKWAIGEAIRDARAEDRRTTLGRRLREGSPR